MAKIVIEIECETQAELISHLQKIEEDIISKGLRPDVDVSALTRFTLDDANCYGEHAVAIYND